MPARYVPDRELPPYTYIPGRAPHPLSDPRGHSYGRESRDAQPAGGAGHAPSVEFLWGVDLFNHGYYWEAHEAWESIWLSAGRETSRGRFLQALIKLAAAGVKAREGRPAGIRRHAARARELLDGIPEDADSQNEVIDGVSVQEARALCDEMVNVRDDWSGSGCDPQRVIEGQLRITTASTGSTP